MESDNEKRVKITIKDNNYTIEYSKDLTLYDIIAILEITKERISETATKNLKVHLV